MILSQLLSAIIPMESIQRDILLDLPPEISIYILLHLNLHDLLNCQLVSRYWHILASDNLIYRDLFHRFGWQLAEHVKDTPPPSPAYTPPTLSRSSSFNSLSLGMSRSNSFNRSSFAHAVAKNRPFSNLAMTSPADGSNSGFIDTLNSLPSTPLNLKPTSLDWYQLFKSRLQLENHWFGACEPKIDFLDGHTDSVGCCVVVRMHLTIIDRCIRSRSTMRRLSR